MNGKKSVTLALLGCFIVIVGNRGVNGTFPKPRTFLGLSIAFLMIGFLVEFAPKLGAAFAWLIFISLTLTEGPDLFKATAKIGGPHK